MNERDLGIGTPESLARDAADFHRAMLDFIRIQQLRDRERLGSHRVSAAAAHAIDAVSRLGPISLNQLATELFVEKSTASRIVDGLEEKGFLRRVTGTDDKRVLRLEVTRAGRELHARLTADALEDSTEMLRVFASDARRGIIGRMRHIASASATRAGFVDAACSRIEFEWPQGAPAGIVLRTASPFDRDECLDLLEVVGLREPGLARMFPSGYLVARDRHCDDLLGVAGLERHGVEGVLRAVAVRPSARGAGLARALTLAVMDLARVAGIRELFVVSPIGADAFERLGWEKLDTGQLPESLDLLDLDAEFGRANSAVLRWRVG